MDRSIEIKNLVLIDRTLPPRYLRFLNKKIISPAFIFIIFFQGFVFCAPKIHLVDWRDLSDRDLSPTAKMALATQKEQWKHAETEHFIYHFTDEALAEIVYLQAEFYYGWVKDFFGVRQDTWKKKGHIFVFGEKDVWKAFVDKAGPGRMESGGFTNGWELYLFRKPYWLAPVLTLSHELTHLIVFRFLEGPVPLFLNEGVAEYVSFRAAAAKVDGDQHRLGVLKDIPEKERLKVRELVDAADYPSGREKAFYAQSEKVVRLLVDKKGSAVFYSFLRQVSAGEAFEKVLTESYGWDIEDLEQAVKA